MSDASPAAAPVDVRTAAADAAVRVFDRSLKLMAPPRHLVEDAINTAADILLARFVGAVDAAGRLNQPMLARLRACAADTSSDWQAKFTIHPPEARGLVDLLDKLDGDPDVPAADRIANLRRALGNVVSAATRYTDPADAVAVIRVRAEAALAADLPATPGKAPQ